ncbi:unnamed protein product [Phaeothamnion confervicola]
MDHVYVNLGCGHESLCRARAAFRPQVTKPQETIDAIVRASDYPLSIVLVGVGDGPWGMMRKFDDGLPERRFDNYQFVEYNRIVRRHPNNAGPAFACHCLMEIPDQFKAIRKLNLLNAPLRPPVHRPPGLARVLDPPPGSLTAAGTAPLPVAPFVEAAVVPPSAPSFPAALPNGSAPCAASTGSGSSGGNGSAGRRNPDAVPNEFLCPLTLSMMEDPVIVSDGHTYERCAIEQWLAEHRTSPMSNEPLASGGVVPNRALRSAIEVWRAGTQHPR